MWCSERKVSGRGFVGRGPGHVSLGARVVVLERTCLPRSRESSLVGHRFPQTSDSASLAWPASWAVVLCGWCWEVDKWMSWCFCGLGDVQRVDAMYSWYARRIAQSSILSVLCWMCIPR